MQVNKKVGLIGCGRWGKNILRDLIAQECSVTVFERSADGREYAKNMGIHSIYADLSETDEVLDGYVVAVQTENHYQVLKKLADYCRPVFVEKPMVSDLTQAYELAEFMGDRLFVMHKWRYHPGVKALAELRRSGRYGKLQRLMTRRVQWGHPHRDVDALWILMPHDASIVLHILGYLPPVRAVQATTVENSINSVVAFLGDEPSVTIDISAINPGTSRLINVFFERAVVSLMDPLANHLEVRYLDEQGNATENVDTIPIATDWPLLLEIKAFIHFLKGGERPDSSIEDELRILSTLSDIRTLALHPAKKISNCK